jgi:hypothetical protein
MFEQMSGKAMSQSVRGNVFEISDGGVVIDDGPEELACEWLVLV